MAKDNREIEVKVLDVDIKNFVSRLKKLGGKLVDEYNYYRIIYDYADKRLDKDHAWIRLRTDGKKTTITYKKVHDSKVDGKEEHEVIVDSFDAARNILKSIGLVEQRTQESRRIMFELDGVEVDVDLWPMIPPYVEVEAGTKKKLLDTLRKLDIDVKKTYTYTGKELFAHHNINLDDYKNLKLEKEKKEMKIV